MLAATIARLVLADVGQRPDAGDVADRPQALAGAQVRVDRNAAGVGDHAERLQADPVHARAPAGGHEQTVAAQLAAVTQLQDVVLAVAPRGAHARAEDQLDPVAAQDLAERLAQRLRLAGQHTLGTLDQHHLAAETADGLRQLHPDPPAAEHEQPARHRLHAGRLAARPHPVELAQAPDRRDDRLGAGGEHDVRRSCSGRRRPPRRRGRRAGRCRAAGRCLVGQPALLAGVGVVGDHEVAPASAASTSTSAVAPRRARLDGLARPQQRLGRDARPVGALAADQLALHHRHPQAALGQRAGGVLAGRAAADHDHVIVACSSRTPDRSGMAVRSRDGASIAPVGHWS